MCLFYDVILAPKYAKENATFTILSYINNEVKLMFNIPVSLSNSGDNMITIVTVDYSGMCT